MLTLHDQSNLKYYKKQSTLCRHASPHKQHQGYLIENERLIKKHIAGKLMLLLHSISSHLPHPTCLMGHSLSVFSCGAMRSVAPISSIAYGRWFAPSVRHSVRMTYRPSAALWLLGSLRISYKNFYG